MKFFGKGMVVRHHSGNVYTILDVTNTAAPSEKFPITVVYMGANGNVWSRSLSDFSKKFEVLYDGENKALVQRADAPISDEQTVCPSTIPLPFE